MEIRCFKAYDIRGRLPDELNDDVVYRIGRAYALFVQPQRVVVGRDVRLSSDALSQALINGLLDAGVDVYDIGLCGTEEVYFATSSENMDGGIMVTASHNPLDYNGLKLVREQAKPISDDTGLRPIRTLAEQGEFPASQQRGTLHTLNVRGDYIQCLLSYINTDVLAPVKVVVNAGNGCAGPVVDLLQNVLPFELITIHNNPDGTFPNGIPNPLLPENRAATAAAVLCHNAVAGVAWDGDFDRCFLFDEKGRFIEGYYIVGLLAAAFLAKNPGEKIVHDPRLVWNTLDVVERAGGEAVISKSGHSFMKETMRDVDAIYGGEMSAHHFFRDFSYCDSGMIPWLLVLELMATTGQTLSALVDDLIKAYPSSGEINRTIDDAPAALKALELHYAETADFVSHLDGLSISFPCWRFNLRSSNTEPVVRLNVESRADQTLMEQKTAEILHWLSCCQENSPS